MHTFAPKVTVVPAPVIQFTNVWSKLYHMFVTIMQDVLNAAQFWGTPKSPPLRALVSGCFILFITCIYIYIGFHLLKNMSPVGFKGNLSLLQTYCLCLFHGT